jgi:hypothetical protein
MPPTIQSRRRWSRAGRFPARNTVYRQQTDTDPLDLGGLHAAGGVDSMTSISLGLILQTAAAVAGGPVLLIAGENVPGEVQALLRAEGELNH